MKVPNKKTDLSKADLRFSEFREVIGYTVLSTTFNSSRENNQLNYIVEWDTWKGI